MTEYDPNFITVAAPGYNLPANGNPQKKRPSRKAAPNPSNTQKTNTNGLNTPVVSRPVDTADNSSETFPFNLNMENMINGVILSEILGKPRSKRRGRW